MTDPKRRNIPALLDHFGARGSSSVAIEDEHDAVSYAELADRVGALVGRLADEGVGPGDRVALCLPSCIAFAEAFLAILSRRAAVVPIDPRAPRSEVARTVADAGAILLVSRPELTIARVGGNSTAPQISHQGDAALLAYSFTSSPRTLMSRTQENLWWEAENLCASLRLHADDVILAVVPLAHAYGLGNGLLAALRSGARLVLRDRFVRREILQLLTTERVTVFPAVPVMLRVLAVTDAHHEPDLSALRLCLSAGAPLPSAVSAAFSERFDVPTRQLYGLTETGSVACDVAGIDPTSVGRPLENVRVSVREVGTAASLPVGEVGEIVVNSTAAAGGIARAIHTRDLGYVHPDGRLVVTGRMSSFINVAGNKVDPAEVAAALRAHPAVADVEVSGITVDYADQAVAAVVTAATPVTVAALRAHCRQHLAPYKVPRLLSVSPRLARTAAP